GVADVASGDDGTTGHHHPHPGACRVVAISPCDGAAVVSDVRVTYSTRVAPTSIVLTEVGGGPVAARTRLADDGRTVVIDPTHSLPFWARYRAEIEAAPCPAVDATFATVVPRVPARELRPASINALARIGDTALASVGGYRGFQVLA